MRKIHGRPRLPWWAYIGYFLLALYASIFHAIGSEMPQQTVKINEDSLARAIVKAMKTMEKDELADEGRFGDSELAHVNPEEKAMLKARGGAGTTNPRTGLREFYDMGTGDVDPGYSGVDPSPYGGGTNVDTGGVDPGLENLDTNQSFGAGGLGAPTSQGTGSLVDTITKFASNYPVSPTGLAAYGMARGLGKYVGEPLDRAFGGRGIAQESQFSPGQQMGGEGRNDSLSAAMGVQPAVQQASAYMRPQAIEPPANLGMQGMSDIQKRTMMATYGSQGAQSQYRTPEAMRAYGNLIARSLIGDNNQITGNETGTLPIEDQYLRQVFGIQKPNSAQSLLDALKPY